MPTFDVLSHYNIDEKLEKDGAKMFLPEDPEGKAYFLVRPYPNDEQQRMIAELFADNESIFKKGGDEGEQLDRELTAQVHAKTILVGCGGMKEKYSYKFALACMNNSRIRAKVLEFALTLNNYRLKEEEIKEK